MTKNIFKRGFTLIELLVVIAIIGILASVVLASLNSARSKGEDAANKSNLNNMRAQAELYYSDAGGYAGLCTAVNSDNDNNGNNDFVSTLDDGVASAVAGAGGTCFSTTAGYSISVDLDNPAGDSYCIDNTGYSGENTVAASAESNDIACDGA